MSTAESADPSLSQVQESFSRLRQELDSVVLGQGRMKDRVLICLLAGGHALIEGVPGTAKTLLALALSRLLGCRFRRIQFTPDLMPIDLLGTSIYDQKTQEFVFQPGPVFTDVLLADEVNRTTPRTQSALLEAMQERAATIDGVRRAISPVFFVIATQNPVEYEGTYLYRRRRRTASCSRSKWATPPARRSWPCCALTGKAARCTRTAWRASSRYWMPRACSAPSGP